MFDKYDRMLMIDFETTGLDYRKDRIIEIGMIVLEKNCETRKFEVLEEYNRFVRIDFKLSQVIIDLTSITDEILKREGVFEEEVFQKLMTLLDDKTLILAYNLQFDISFLIELIKRYQPQFMFNSDCLDVMAVYKDRYPFPHKLKNAIEAYAVEIQNTHRAVDDVKATFEVLKKMILEKNNVEKYVNVLGFNQKYGVSGIRLKHIQYIAQYGGRREIEKLRN